MKSGNVKMALLDKYEAAEMQKPPAEKPRDCSCSWPTTSYDTPSHHAPWCRVEADRIDEAREAAIKALMRRFAWADEILRQHCADVEYRYNPDGPQFYAVCGGHWVCLMSDRIYRGQGAYEHLARPYVLEENATTKRQLTKWAKQHGTTATGKDTAQPVQHQPGISGADGD